MTKRPSLKYLREHVATTHRDTYRTLIKQRVGNAVFAVGLFFATVVGQAAAQSGSGVCSGSGKLPPAIRAVVRLLNRLQEYGIAIALAAAAVALVYSGILVIVGRGDPQKIERAKQVVVYTVFGLVIVLLSTGLVEVIKQPLCPS